MRWYAIFILISLFVCGLCAADTIVLKEGQTLTGDILVEKDDELVVDIPVELVFRRIQEDSQADIIQYGYKAVLKRE